MTPPKQTKPRQPAESSTSSTSSTETTAAPKDIKVTPFRQRVYEATSAIPKGKVTTYAAIARAIGCGAPRAVGQALRHNPFAPTVPCHRVVGSNRSLTGFNGATEGSEMQRKRKLLESEGVTLDPGGTVSRECILDAVPRSKK